MAGYIENGLDGLMLNAYEKDELRRQGDLVIEGFRILGNNHWTTTRGPHDTIGCPHHPAEYLPDRLDCKKARTDSTGIFHPYCSQPGPTLKLILEIQLEIDESLNQIKDVFYNIPSSPQKSSSTRLDDRHLEDFKDFRTIGLQEQFKHLARRNQKLFSISRDLILHLKLSQGEPKFPTDLDSIREEMKDGTTDSIEATKRVIQWIEGSEFDLVQQGWIKSNMQLARQFLPIMKLSRLLLKKLSKRGMGGEEGIELYTELCSEELSSLSGFSCTLHVHLVGIVCILTSLNHPADHGDVARVITGMVEALEIKIESPLALISSHFVPMLTADINGFSVQNYYREWLMTWNTQLSLAISNFKDAIELYKTISHREQGPLGEKAEAKSLVWVNNRDFITSYFLISRLRLLYKKATTTDALSGDYLCATCNNLLFEHAFIIAGRVFPSFTRGAARRLIRQDPTQSSREVAGVVSTKTRSWQSF
ncbi:hypothetical protein KEM48_014043 [Puccinia striiformis f. sp. tritici PST-130]|nr:hypothetical protein KEM48_014043 [Puccinia striiformis f. sp. tritici PST-130]